MLKKIPLLFSFILLSFILTAQQDSVRIEKAVLLFYDSTEIAPMVTQIPFYEATEALLNIKYKNTGNRMINNYALEFEIIHNSYPQGGVGVGLVYSNRVIQDTIAVGEVIDFELSLPRNGSFPSYQFCYFGKYETKFIISDSLGIKLDSNSFHFEVTDSIYSKSDSIINSISSGPGLFRDTVLNQLGGTVQGDRFGTIFKFNQLYLLPVPGPRPISVSFYISKDTSNIGNIIIPKIWEASFDSAAKKIIVGQEVASGMIPYTIDSSNLGQMTTLQIRAILNYSYVPRLYVVGFESVLANPRGRSLLIGRDTLSEQLQPDKSSFVYFGQDTNWYSIDILPIINLNFSRSFFLANQPIFGCLPVNLEERIEDQEELIIYPNPSTGIFNIENFEVNQNYQVYNVNGKLVEASIVNGQLDLNNQPNGIYLLRVLLENGAVVSKKLMKS